ncbi:MAG: hypothetical protein ACRDHC_00875 [Actinomycetota bacterium]
MAETKKRTKAGRTPSVSEVPRTTDPDDGRPVCTVAFCPICMAVTTAQTVAPDAVEHLLNAAREFLLAARAVVDARADDLARQQNGKKNLERIEIA